MTTEQKLQARSNGSCELCESKESLSVYEVPPNSDGNEDESILVCEVCKAQLEKRAALDANHWGCLNTSMWSEVPAVKVVSWRMLNRLKTNSWAADAIDMMYLEEDQLTWARAAGDEEDSG